MKTNESLKFAGRLKIVLADKDGNIKDERDVDNRIVDTGLVYILNQMANADQPTLSEMRVGEGSTDPGADTSDLTTPIDGGVATITGINVNEGAKQLTYTATFTAGVGTGAIQEAGIFNSSSTMLCMTTFPTVNKQALDSMTISWVISVSAVL